MNPTTTRRQVRVDRFTPVWLSDLDRNAWGGASINAGSVFRSRISKAERANRRAELIHRAASFFGSLAVAVLMILALFATIGWAVRAFLWCGGF